MPPFAVIENFYVPKDVLAGLIPCHIAFMVKHLTFYRAEERLSTGIIIAVSFPAHAAHHLVLLQQRLVFLTGVLAASV